VSPVVALIDEEPNGARLGCAIGPSDGAFMWHFLLSAVLIIYLAAETRAQNAETRDYGAMTCRAFLGAGKDNMAVIIWWLRGHHAGATGINPFNSQDPYAKRLGFFCGNHPGANLLETSERILTELDRGI